jgi:drug/metabolite transporter (DMT)-like permease
MHMTQKSADNATLLISCLFVLLWSTGFIVGRLIVGSASPNIFLAIRFFLSSLLFAAIAIALKKNFPPVIEWHRHALAGLFINGIYLGGSYWAISQGFPAALMALLGALHPVFTMVIGLTFMRESVRPAQATGIFVGLFGVAMVLFPTIALQAKQSYTIVVPLIALTSVLSITWGTILQKMSIAKSELLPSLAIQNASATITAITLAFVLGESQLSFNGELLFALSWAVLILSGLGTYLLIFLVRSGSATKATSLMLLAPPLAALEAWLLFGDKLMPLQMLGFAFALLGVGLCRK